MFPRQDDIKIFRSADEVAQAAADEFIRLAKIALSQRGLFTVALAGGSTPKRLYQLLAEINDDGFPEAWRKIHFFFGDERHVPPDNAESNYRMAKETLLSKINAPPANIHRIPAENPDAIAAAAQYEKELKSFFTKANRLADGFPIFDLILLGMGPDGHTASLFPGSAGLEEKSRWVIANRIEKLKTERITLTFPVFNHAGRILFLVCGEDKAAMIEQVLGKNTKPGVYPVQNVEPVNGSKLWLLDEAAAQQLKR